MKTKLLKKVRKHFSIVDYPNGFKDFMGDKWPSMFKVISSRGLFRNVAHFAYGLHKEKAFELAYEYLKGEIHSRYDTKKWRAKKKTVKKEEFPSEKVWPPEIKPVEEGGGLVAW